MIWRAPKQGIVNIPHHVTHRPMERGRSILGVDMARLSPYLTAPCLEDEFNGTEDCLSGVEVDKSYALAG
jgi:hypothetical protein